MALFTGREKATVPELIARRKYRAALDLLKEQLKLRPDDKSLRMQSADVLIMLGMVDNAVRVLTSVADDFAAEGFAAKAVAVLKRIQRLEPDRTDIEARIVQIFKGGAPAPGAEREDAVVRGLKAQGIDHRVVSAERTAAPAPEPEPESAPDSFAAELSASADLDIDIAVGAVLPAEAPLSPESARMLASLGIAQPEAGVEASPGLEPALVDLELFEQSSRRPGEAPETRVVSPLFDDFAGDEMIEFIRGLELLTFEPGDIIVTEGEAGGSLFVITAGFVKAFVRNAEGGSTRVRQLREGDFFGEISVLSGMPRTATITAASPCELLRLDRATLDEIARRKPRVREVLQRFFDERLNNAAEAEIRGIEVGPGSPSRR